MATIEDECLLTAMDGWKKTLLELAEARAQIAAKDAEIERLRSFGRTAMAELAAKDAEIEKIAEYVERAGADEQELRAQIAAKDAELERLRTLVGRWIDGVPLAKSAREPE